MKWLVSATLALLILTLPVNAAGFSGIKCEDAEVIKIMEDQLRNSRDQGSSLLSYGIHVERITKSKTLQSSTNKLICAISLRVTYRGESQSIRLRFTYEQLPGGKKISSISLQ